MGFCARIGNMAETCPFSETLWCRDRDETETLELRDRDETETLKNSVSRLSQDRDMSLDTTALLAMPMACRTFCDILRMCVGWTQYTLLINYLVSESN